MQINSQFSHVNGFSFPFHFLFLMILGRGLEAKSNKLLPRGMASHRKCPWYCWRDLHHIALQKEYRISPENELQPARSPFRRKNR